MKSLSVSQTLLYVLLAAICFHAACLWPPVSWLVFGYLFALVQLAHARSPRWAFYSGLAVGLFTAGPQLECFWRIFGPAALALWLVLAFWIGLFVALARLCLLRFPPFAAAALLPLLWTGLEYFRSELYYLRFSWLSPGYILLPNPLDPGFGVLGVYGAGFVLVAVAAALSVQVRFRSRLAICAGIICATGIVVWLDFRLRQSPHESSAQTVNVAGVQLEFPTEPAVVKALDGLLKRDPAADLVVLCEYTLDGPVPDGLRQWCVDHRRYLVVGGKDPAARNNYYDTAFVVGPTGAIVFRQGKSVPIQFFKDGLPAARQAVWNSPWGKIGICICYDLSYTRVTDGLIRLGAQALVVPTMDVADWGSYEHQLHARVAPTRAAEYGIPIFRVASSGISQLADADGRVLNEAPFPGELACVQGRLTLSGTGRLPWDRWVAPLSTCVTAGLCLAFLARYLLKDSRRGELREPQKSGCRVTPPSDSAQEKEALL